MKKTIYVLLISLFVFTLISIETYAGQKEHGITDSGHDTKHVPASPAMVHMHHAEVIHSEKDFLREMIPHHQEAIDTSVLLFVSTKDPELKKLTESIYKAQTREILDMRLSYAMWYNLIPTGAMYQPMMRDLNVVDGEQRDIRYVQDMIVHHQGAVDMAEKVLTFKGLHNKTVKFANDIITAQKAEIEFMKNWLKKKNAGE